MRSKRLAGCPDHTSQCATSGVGGPEAHTFSVRAAAFCLSWLPDGGRRAGVKCERTRRRSHGKHPRAARRVEEQNASAAAPHLVWSCPPWPGFWPCSSPFSARCLHGTTGKAPQQQPSALRQAVLTSLPSTSSRTSTHGAYAKAHTNTLHTRRRQAQHSRCEARQARDNRRYRSTCRAAQRACRRACVQLAQARW